jgi:hypothetical protein
MCDYPSRELSVRLAGDWSRMSVEQEQDRRRAYQTAGMFPASRRCKLTLGSVEGVSALTRRSASHDGLCTLLSLSIKSTLSVEGVRGRSVWLAWGNEEPC